MGKFFELDKIDSSHDTGWIIPYNLIRYDQRYKPWPNELFPFSVEINSWNIINPDKDDRIAIRRFCERECKGDVLLEKFYKDNTLMFVFWFDLLDDKNIFITKWVKDIQ